MHVLTDNFWLLGVNLFAHKSALVGAAYQAWINLSAYLRLILRDSDLMLAQAFKVHLLDLVAHHLLRQIFLIAHWLFVVFHMLRKQILVSEWNKFCWILTTFAIRFTNSPQLVAWAFSFAVTVHIVLVLLHSCDYSTFHLLDQIG